jgi:hypothetical protein
MDEQIIQDILTEVFSSLEPLDAQISAILQFLKAKGLATDDELAPFLEQAGNASNVRWLAARVRIASLLSSALKTEKPEKKQQQKSSEEKPKAKQEEKPTAKQDEKSAEKPEQKSAEQPAATAAKTSEPHAEKPKPTTQKKETEPKPSTPQASNDEAPEKPASADTTDNKKETNPPQSGKVNQVEQKDAA